MKEKQPILSICIPIYNREIFLERMLERFLEDKDLFESKISLYISDNCSQEDLSHCCLSYQEKGLKLVYHRNETNIGPDANFEYCFRQATGKYVWLLGSDDIPIRGFLRLLLGYIENDIEFGLVHLCLKKKKKDIAYFHSSDEMAVAVNYWITFMSANIILTKSLETIDLSEFYNSFMIQVPAYLNACCSYEENIVIFQPQFFEKESDSVNNGGYNLFKVFVKNLFEIYEFFIRKGLLSKKAFDKMIKIEYYQFLSGFIVDQLIFRKKSNFDTDGGWLILRKYYDNKPYAYYYLLVAILRYGMIYLMRPVIKPIYNMIRK